MSGGSISVDDSVGGCERSGGGAACGPVRGNGVYTVTITAWSDGKRVKRGAAGAGG
ncbi:MAG TPA: hypothetical protein VK920_10210 [Solirubrobacterales bacterium]|nr:hypothetical protein [Solirubrobacterales bacterium]